MNEKIIVRLLRSVRYYIPFFLLMAFVVTCCMLLFLNITQNSMGGEFTQNHIELAAKLTFGNVVQIIQPGPALYP